MDYLITKYYKNRRACAILGIIDALNEEEAIAKAKKTVPRFFNDDSRYTATPYIDSIDGCYKPKRITNE